MTATVIQQLGEVCSINPAATGISPSPDDVLDFFPMSAVNAACSTAVSQDGRAYSEVRKGYTAFEDGDVLLAKITPCFENGKIAQAKVRTHLGFGSTEFHVLRPHAGKLDARYLVHFLRRDQIRIDGERKMTGSAGQRRVPRHFLESLLIPLPSLPEQRRVAAILDQADALRAKRRDALAQSDALPQSIFIEMFGDPNKNPKQWPRVQFGNLLEAIESGWSPTCLDRAVQGQEWGVLKLGAVTRCEYIDEENKALPLDVAPRAELEVRPGDLLFTRKNTYELVAACALVRSTRPRLIIPDLIFRFRFRPDADLDPCYLHQLLVTPSKRKEMQKLASGSAGSMPNISKSKLLTALIELPPVALQKEFAARISAVQRQREVQRKAISEADTLFASLQRRGFEGQL